MDYLGGALVVNKSGNLKEEIDVLTPTS